LTVSEQVRQFCLKEDGLAPGKVITLYNGIDMEKIARTPPAASLFDASIGPGPIICNAAHVRRVKGLDVFIRAASLVCSEVPEARFLILGKNSEAATFMDLQQQVRSLNLEKNVFFLGEKDDILPILKRSEIFCLLSRSEGFSNALIEAMACGVPSIATSVGGNTEAIEDGRSGFLVANEDAEGAAKRILELIRDPNLARRIGEAGRKVVENMFTNRAMRDQLVQIYRNLLTSRKPWSV
jgi:glycosyltransferase involved in cell wall biosynthesis